MRHAGRWLGIGATIVAMAGLAMICGCSHPNVVTNELPNKVTLNGFVHGKNIVLLIQPEDAPMENENGYWQGYGGGEGSEGGENERGERAGRGAGNQREERMNGLIQEACDSELVADSVFIPQQLTDSASSAAMLAGNCSGYQADYALLVNGQVLNFQAPQRGGGRRRGGYPGGGMQEQEMSAPGLFSQAYGQRGGWEGGGERRSINGSITFYITLFRISDCKRMFIAQAETGSFSPSDHEASVKEIRSALQKLFEVEGEREQ